MISAVAVVSVKSPESKKIYDLGVFGVTAITSLFAYVWLYIVLKVWTENEVTIWEACITLAFFFILLIAAFIADKINACCKKKKEGKMGITARGGNFDVDDFIHILSIKKSEIKHDKDQLDKHAEIQRFFTKTFGDVDPNSLT